MRETSGNFWKVSWKFPETSELLARHGNFYPINTQRAKFGPKHFDFRGNISTFRAENRTKSW